MRQSSMHQLIIITAVLCFSCMGTLTAQDAEKSILTGPSTEKRFPALVLPEGFKATLFACDPLIEYPSVIATGPKHGAVFIAQDYMTGLGYNSPRRSEIKLVEDRDNDGYAETTTLYAGEFNSIQGLAYDAGIVFAMHAPYLTALRDTDGDGRADERKDLLTGLGLNPKENPNLLHCANGVTVGHDGWLYLSLGDRGCNVKRPEGDRLIYQGGGILRCRHDGRDLHVFATGLRNIYDVALDEELNVFIRDNENDGGDYMIRVCHSFLGADHGYPYLYYERPQEALLPMADLGRGSSAGGVCYLETAFPKDYRGNLFFCEWGKSLVRYERRPYGSSFAPCTETEFSATADTDPYGFKPTDVIVESDGSILLSDWGDGQRPKRGRGRIYRIQYGDKNNADASNLNSVLEKKEAKDWIEQLDSPSYFVRIAAQQKLIAQGKKILPAIRKVLEQGELERLGRFHAIWILTRLDGTAAVDDLLDLAKTDKDSSVRAQAIRALADLTDPLLVQHRLNAGKGDVIMAEKIAQLADNNEPKIMLEVIIALGRLHWKGSPEWLRENLKNPDQALEHATQQTLRRSGNWSAVLQLLDQPSDNPIRKIALRALASQAESVITDSLIERLKNEKDAKRRIEYADLLSRVYKKPGEWVYWGYRPAPRTPNSLEWERTEQIAQALDQALREPAVATEALRRMQREEIPVELSTLKNWLETERRSDSVAVILDSFHDRPAKKIQGSLKQIILDTKYATENRSAAFAMFVDKLEPSEKQQLFQLARNLEDSRVNAEVIEALGKYPSIPSGPFLVTKLICPNAEVRAAAVTALTALKQESVHDHIPTLLRDRNVIVRRATATAAGKLKVKAAIQPLRKLTLDSDAIVRREGLDSLRLLNDASVVSAALSALKNEETQLAALRYLREFGGIEQLKPVSEVINSNRSTDVIIAVVRALSAWKQNAKNDSESKRRILEEIASIQGKTGTLLRWEIVNENQDTLPISTAGLIVLKSDSVKQAGNKFNISTTVTVDRPVNVQFLGASSTGYEVFLNEKSLFSRSKPGKFQSDADRFEASLLPGTNQIIVTLNSSSTDTQFQLRFRQKSSKAEYEQLTQLALQGRGSVRRGEEIFLKVEKSLCLKCHRLGDKGGKIGPDLKGIGSRFSRIHIVESILEPSRNVAPSYGATIYVLESGQIVTGVKISETDKIITVGDSEGKTREILKAEIDESRKQAKSIMPEGIEKRLSQREFIDLIAFLLSQKKK